MSSAAAVQLLTPADLETRLAALGIPAADYVRQWVAASTWSDWRAGRTRPRADKWNAVITAFQSLVAERSMAPAAPEAEAPPVEPVVLTGSSAPTGAPPRFTPVATVPAPADAPTAGDLDAEVIGLAGRLTALVQRQNAVLGRAIDIQGRLDAWDFANRPPRPPERPSRMVCTDVSTATHRITTFTESLADLGADRLADEAYVAACKAHGRLKRRKIARTRQPYLQKLADRMWCRVYRWVIALAGMAPVTRDGLMAKTAAAVAVAAVARDDDWGQALTEAANRDAVRLDDAALMASRAAVEATAGDHPSHSPARAEMMATVARYHRTGGAVTGSEPNDHPRLRAFSNAFRAVKSLTEDLADRPAVTLADLGTKAAVFAAIASEAAMAGESTIGFASEVEDFPRLTRSIIADAARLCTGGIPLASTAPGEVAALTAEWVRTAAVDERAGVDMGKMNSRHPDFQLVLDRGFAAANANSAVLRRLADLRSMHPDVLALKAAVILLDAKGARGLDWDIANPSAIHLSDMEVVLALSIVRDVIDALEEQVQRLVTTVETAAAEAEPVDARVAA